MIDITTDRDIGLIEVDGKEYNVDICSLNELVKDIVERCLYSGESIILYSAIRDKKELVQEWVNPHVSSRYNRRHE